MARSTLRCQMLSARVSNYDAFFLDPEEEASEEDDGEE